MANADTSPSELKPLNKGTTILIQSRCEKSIRGSLLRWTGLPLGGSSALVLFITVLVWVPQQVIESDLMSLGHDLLREYVEDIVTTSREFGNELDSLLRVSVTQRAEQQTVAHVKTVSQEQVGQLLVSNVESSIHEALEEVIHGPEMEIAIQASVAHVLQADDFKAVREVIKSSMESVAKGLSESIAKNAENTVRRVNSTLPEKQIINKSNYQVLRDILDGLKARRLPEGDFALKFFAAAETYSDHRYDPNVTIDYLQQLRDALGEQFRFVLIMDAKERFLASVVKEA